MAAALVTHTPGFTTTHQVRRKNCSNIRFKTHHYTIVPLIRKTTLIITSKEMRFSINVSNLCNLYD
jgi:hypothetical protein